MQGTVLDAYVLKTENPIMTEQKHGNVGGLGTNGWPDNDWANAWKCAGCTELSGDQEHEEKQGKQAGTNGHMTEPDILGPWNRRKRLNIPRSTHVTPQKKTTWTVYAWWRYPTQYSGGYNMGFTLPNILTHRHSGWDYRCHMAGRPGPDGKLSVESNTDGICMTLCSSEQILNYVNE